MPAFAAPWSPHHKPSHKEQMNMKVTKVMTRKLITGQPQEGLREAFFRMKQNRIRHLPVVDDEMNLLGLVTDRNLRRPDWVDEAPDIAHVYYLDDHMTLGDVMTTDVIAVHTYDHVDKAARIMHENRFGAVPVLNKEERLDGMLSAVDLLVVLEELLNEQRRLKKNK
ncbi:putative signal transduction protein with CBS domains [Alkalilimnicola ehrlichii MLHE-1]|uniref:Putative signal transduction protein with CBS domains n=2 Tax=Alkalilimnicola ehrlichii TaxID=351052 RepID=Q0A573_ALKEH|nr:putative signal transduction protein with CBS domains [Alkalilimnicola ehrlichii MLHE-1]